MDKKKQLQLFGVGMFFGALALAFILHTMNLAPKDVQDKFEKSAVERGYAHYMVNRTNKEVIFVWNNQTNDVKNNTISIIIK